MKFKQKPSDIVFVATINGNDFEFASEKDMRNYVDFFRSQHNEIHSISLHRVEFFNLLNS